MMNPEKKKGQKKIAIIGYGSQAKVWASNLRDSGRHITIVVRPNSNSAEQIKQDGFDVLFFNSNGLKQFSLFILLTSDSSHLAILEQLRSSISSSSLIIYAHGQSLIQHELEKKYPQWGHGLLAPKAIASEVRSLYLSQGKLAAVYSTQYCLNSQMEEDLHDIARDLGVRAGPYQSTFFEESRADLFSEQSILCSLIPYGALKSYQLLRSKGVSPELAYLECWHEVKLIADAMLKYGPAGLFKLISPNALLGSEKAQKLIFDSAMNEKFEVLLQDVWSGNFEKEIELTEKSHTNLKQEILKRWESEEITQAYLKIKNDLY